jgi:hypothetical protein
MTPEELDRLLSSHHAHNDDHGRDDLCGGIGWVLLIAAVICVPLIAAFVWRMANG